MSQKTFILIGRSGCGKGTQGALLSQYLQTLEPKRDVLYIQCGGEFRKFIQGDSVTEKLSREVSEKGVLQPEFLAIYMWVNYLVKNYKGTEHIIIDGTPRKIHEAGVLDSIFSFYNLDKPTVIYINVSKEWSVERLMKRGRADDKREEIIERLSWFETEVLPTIEYYRNSKSYSFVEINGEQDIDSVRREIISKIK